jgi:hypothetical protein
VWGGFSRGPSASDLRSDLRAPADVDAAGAISLLPLKAGMALVIAGFAACLIPALRASRIDPRRALSVDR